MPKNIAAGLILVLTIAGCSQAEMSPNYLPAQTASKSGFAPDCVTPLVRTGSLKPDMGYNCPTPDPVSTLSPPAPDPDPCNAEGTCDPGCVSSGLSCGGNNGGGTAYNGTPKDGQKCDGSQYEIGSPVEPSNNNAANAPYYVTNIENVWANGVIVSTIYQVYSPGAAGQLYYFIQETNNGASVNWGTSVGLSFGPVNISVSGGEDYNLVSPLTWFFPGTTPLGSGSTAVSCWPASGMPS